MCALWKMKKQGGRWDTHFSLLSDVNEDLRVSELAHADRYLQVLRHIVRLFALDAATRVGAYIPLHNQGLVEDIGGRPVGTG